MCGNEHRSRMVQQRVVRTRRLRVEHVQAGAGQVPGVERLGDGGSVHDRSTCGVDEDRAPLHPADRRPVDQVAGLVVERHVHGDVVRPRQRLGEIGHGRAAGVDDGRLRDVWVEALDRHLERAAARRDLLPDAPESDDQHGVLVELEMVGGLAREKSRRAAWPRRSGGPSWRPRA